MKSCVQPPPAKSKRGGRFCFDTLEPFDMDASTTKTTTSALPSSFFNRAKARLFGGSPPAAKPAASESPAGPAPGGVASQLTREYQIHRAAPATAPARAVTPAPSVVHAVAAPEFLVAGRPGKFALEDTPELVALVSGKKPAKPADLAKFRAELAHRGMAVEDVPSPMPRGKSTSRVVCSREAFEAMSHSDRNAFMAAGGAVRDVGFKKHYEGESPTAIANKRRVKFPVQPVAGRTWQQFMAFSKEAVDAYAEKTKHQETGELARIHLFDAYDSLSPASWRYDGPRGGIGGIGGGIDYSKKRIEFREKFKTSLGHCRDFGPYQGTPNDPAPPIDSTALTAADFLAMPEKAVLRLKRVMEGQSIGRNIRAELKRAFETASDSMQTALLGEWEYELFERFPDEWVWPPNPDQP